MLHALDFAAAANQDKTSPFYGKLDMTKVGAMGHSQGAMATASAARDPRVLDIILFNGGDTSSKPYLAVSGDTDLTFYTPSAMASAIGASTVPAAWLYFHQIDVIGKSFSGHLTLQTQPERVAEVRSRYLTRAREVALPREFTEELFELLIAATCAMEDELMESLPDGMAIESLPEAELDDAPANPRVDV